MKWPLILLFGTRLWSAEFHHLYRSAKALMMGDAHTTLATGAATLFYNPALAARNRNFALYPIPLDVGATDFTTEKSRFDNIDTENVEDFADAIIGFPVYLKLGTTPTVKFKWLTLTPFATATANIIVRDKIHPVLDFDYRYDRGFSLGLGLVPYGNSRKGESLAIGGAIKYIKREGIMNLYDVFGTTFADIISSGSTELNEIKEVLGYSVGKGWGGDLGIDWRYQSRDSIYAMGFSILDISDTKIKVYEGSGSLPDQQMSLNFGTSFSKKLNNWIDWTASFDLHPIGAKIDFIQKVHAGIRLGIPLFDFYAGYNGGYSSYGVVFDLFPLEIAVGVYGQEMGGEMKSRRIAAYMSLLDFAF